MNEGGKRKIKIVWNIETRFGWIWFSVIFFKIEFDWSSILLNLIFLISPWR